MLTNIQARLLVQLGRQIEAGSSPNLPNQLQLLFSGSALGRENVTEIANSLSDEDVVSFFKALVDFEKRARMTGGSVSPTIWTFNNIRNRLPDRVDEILDWALRNRGENIYTPVGHMTAARSLEEYKDEQRAKIATRGRRCLELEAEKDQALERKKRKKIEHKERLKDGISRAKRVKANLQELTAVSPSERLQILSNNEFPLEAVPINLIDRTALEKMPDEELKNFLSRIDRRKGTWGSVAKLISGILERK